jgi:hypothetical protein
MCATMQRFVSWGALCFSLVAMIGLVHIEWGRCACREPEAPIGVIWDQERLPDDGTGGPARFGDRFTLTNLAEEELHAVTLTVVGWENAYEVRLPIGDLSPGESKPVPGAYLRWTTAPLDVSPRDVLVIACDGCTAKMVPVRQLGKGAMFRRAPEKLETEAN